MVWYIYILYFCILMVIGMHFITNKQKSILSTHSKSSHYYSLNNHILQQVDCGPYLGVHWLTHDLRWMTHINITRKASSTLGFLHRNLQFCPPSCRKTAYISLVHSSFECSAVVWNPCQQNDIDKLEIILRKHPEICSSLHQPELCHQHAERPWTAVTSK